MAITKASRTLLASTNVPAGTAKGAITGSTVNCTTFYGGEITYKITNGTAPTLPCILTFQVSHDGVTWYDYYNVSGLSATGAITSGSIQLDRGVMYLNVTAHGNTVNNVSAEAYLQAITAL